MNENFQFSSLSATTAILAVASLMSPDHAIWPDQEEPAYVTTHDRPTSSSSDKSLGLRQPSATVNFGQVITTIYATLLDNQVSFGAEFEAVWDDNVSQLYES